jgi:hypothetical protein
MSAYASITDVKLLRRHGSGLHASKCIEPPAHIIRHDPGHDHSMNSKAAL